MTGRGKLTFQPVVWWCRLWNCTPSAGQVVQVFIHIAHTAHLPSGHRCYDPLRSRSSLTMEEANLKWGLSVAEAVKAIKVSRQQLYNVIRGKSAAARIWPCTSAKRAEKFLSAARTGAGLTSLL